MWWIRYRNIVVYGVVLALLAVVLNLINYYYQVRIFSAELYVSGIAILFTALGIWGGRRLTLAGNKSEDLTFQLNSKALEALAITDRELEVLELMADGHSNQQIADRLYISIHTVKSHVSSLLGKMGVERRTQAIKKAKNLNLIR